MAGKIISILILLAAVIAGAGLYYTQVYAFYDRVEPLDDGRDVVVVGLDGADVPLAHAAFQAIDSDSSPIRYRACFATDLTLDEVSAQAVAYTRLAPRVAPRWFDCFDADQIASSLKDGTARAFLGEKNIRFGVDRVVAVTQDGRGFIWHDFNACTDPLASHDAKDRDCPPDETD